MSLQKGFLRPDTSVHPHQLAVAIILGANISLIFYGFCYYLKETFRLLTGSFSDTNILLELTEREHFYYNWFFASIACVLGLQAGIEYYVRNTISHTDKPAKSRRRHLLAYSGFIKWTFLHVFGKIVIAFGGLLLAFALQYDFSMLEDFSYLLILLPLVLYLQQWPLLLKITGRKGLRRMWGFAIVILAASWSMAQIRFYDYATLDDKLRERDPLASNNIRLPSVQQYQYHWKRSTRLNIYVGQSAPDTLLVAWLSDSPKSNARQIRSLLSDQKDSSQWKPLEQYIRGSLQKMYELERDRATAHLFIDEEVSMSWVRALNTILKKNGLRQVVYSTGVKHSKYPANYPNFRDVGVFRWMGFPYPEFERWLDSLEQLDPAAYRVKPLPSYKMRVGYEKGNNRVAVEVADDAVRLNGEVVTAEFLAQFTYQFVKRYTPDDVILLDAKDDASFGDYLTTRDVLRTAIERLRMEKAMEVYGDATGWNDWPYTKRNEIRQMVPDRILEWNPEERRLVQWMKRSKASR